MADTSLAFAFVIALFARSTEKLLPKNHWFCPGSLIEAGGDCVIVRIEKVSAKGMMTEGEAPINRTFCFVSLQTSGREPLFVEHHEFKQVIEKAWTSALQEQPDVESGEYNLNSVSLYALIRVDREPGEALTYLRKVIDEIREATQTAWEEYVTEQGIERAPLLWGETFELRMIDQERELKSLRDFIVQKMLGGEELSNLGFDDSGDNLMGEGFEEDVPGSDAAEFEE